MNLDILIPMTPTATLPRMSEAYVDLVYFVQDQGYWRVGPVDISTGSADFSLAGEPYQVTPVNQITTTYKAV